MIEQVMAQQLRASIESAKRERQERAVAQVRDARTCVEFLRDDYGLTLTNGQRAFVRVTIDGASLDDLTDAEREAAEQMFGDLSDVPKGARRQVVAAFGRDSGKTEICAGIAIYKAMTVDLSSRGLGDIPRAFVVAPDTDTAALTLERAIARIKESPRLAKCIAPGQTKQVITLKRPSDGRLVRFEVKAASRGGKAIRGRSIVCLICDEAALFYGDSYVVNDAEIVKAARPRLLPDGVILLASTPWVEDGLFFDLFTKNHAKPITALVAQGSTLVMRDNDPAVAERIAIERADDPDNADREYNAQFLPGGSSLFFDAEALTLAVENDNALAERQVRAAGADLALVRDSSALAIVARDNANVFELVGLVEKKPVKGEPLKLSVIISEFAAELKANGIDDMTADGHVREPAREWADAENINITAAPEGRDGKWETYELLRSLIAEGRFKLPNNARLLAQLRAVRSKPMPGGGFAITSPRRKGTGHGDLVSALVLGAWAAENTPMRLPVRAEDHDIDQGYRFAERGY